MNWERPIKKIKVKQYKKPIYVDKCMADAIIFVDSLPFTHTVYSCCHHGLFEGRTQLEFRTQLKIPVKGKITRAKWLDKGKYKGYNLDLDLCRCSNEVKKEAQKRWNIYFTDKPIKRIKS